MKRQESADGWPSAEKYYNPGMHACGQITARMSVSAPIRSKRQVASRASTPIWASCRPWRRLAECLSCVGGASCDDGACGFLPKKKAACSAASPFDGKAACTLKRERRPGKAAFWNPPNLFWGWGGIAGALLRFLAPFVALLVRLSAFLAAVGRLVGSFVG